MSRREAYSGERSARRRRRLALRIAGTAARPGPVPDAQVIRNEEEAEVISALQRLRRTDREVLMLALWEELPRHHIATVLGLSGPP